MNKKIFPVVVLVLIIVSLSLIYFKRSNLFPEKEYREVSYLMGTAIEIRAKGKNVKPAVRAAFAEIKRLEKLFNFYDEESEIGQINKMAGKKAVAASQDTFDVICRAVSLSESLGGNFDITIRPLLDLWQFKEKEHYRIPSIKEIRKVLPLVNYRRVEIDRDNKTIKLMRPGMKIDLGGVAKGYAVARARTILVEKGIKSAIINAGSSITVIGGQGGRKFWRIGVQHPRDPEKVLKVIKLFAGQALSTSGDYQRYFIFEGRRYHHILSSWTGYPVYRCQSVTVITGNAIAADILSTAIFIMGQRRGLRLIEDLPDAEGLIVDARGRVFTSSGLKFEKDS